MFENDYTLNGKHATYLKFLAKKNSKDDSSEEIANAARIYERYIDVYMNAAVFGLLYSRLAQRDTESKDRARVYAAQFNTERETCVFLYRMVMLLDRTTELTPDERIDRAFKYDSLDDKEEELKKCMELFNAYVRGGLEIMYEQFTNGCSTHDDYIHRTYQIITDFKKENEGISYTEEISKLLK